MHTLNPCLTDVLSAALDSGVAIGAILVFFCLQFPKNGTVGLSTIETWWGNTVYTKTADWNAIPLKTVPPGGTFGCVPPFSVFTNLFAAGILTGLFLLYRRRPATW